MSMWYSFSHMLAVMVSAILPFGILTAPLHARNTGTGNPAGELMAQSGYYYYNTSGDPPTATITGYSGPGGDVAIPDTLDNYPVTRIGKEAFYDRNSLVSVTIPPSVASIGEKAFYSCNSLVSVTIPASVTIIGKGAFDSCYALLAITVDENNVNYLSMDGVLFSKDKSTLICCPVGKDGAYEIPGGVTSIGDSAFYYCSKLTNVTIPGGVTSIGDSAFGFCRSLTSVTIPSSITSIGDSTFFYCDRLASLVIPAGVTIIGDSTFAYCTSLTDVAIPGGVTSIGDSTFSHCHGLTSITIPGGVTSIGNSAFYCCSGLASVVIPAGVTSIGEEAFSACESLTSVVIPNSVTSIGKKAFAWCSGMTNIVLPDSVTSIGVRAFAYCGALMVIAVDENNANYLIIDGVLFNKDKSTLVCCPGGKKGAYEIPSGVTSLGSGAFGGCGSLTIVSIPDSVTSIGDFAFAYCDSLTNMTIPSNVTSIENATFYCCEGLKSVTIPDSITSIGYEAFRECGNLCDAYFLGDAPSAGDDVFMYTASDFTIWYCRGKKGWTNPWQGYPAFPIIIFEKKSITFTSTHSESLKKDLWLKKDSYAITATFVVSKDNMSIPAMRLLGEKSQISVSIGGFRFNEIIEDADSYLISDKGGTATFTSENGDMVCCKWNARTITVTVKSKLPENAEWNLLDLYDYEAGKYEEVLSNCSIVCGVRWKGSIPWAGTVAYRKGLLSWTAKGKATE